MKKVTSIAVLGLTLLIGFSCKKEKISETLGESKENNSTTTLSNSHTEKVKVFDTSKKFYIEFEASSNNQDLLNLGIQSLKSNELIVLKEKKNNPTIAIRNISNDKGRKTSLHSSSENYLNIKLLNKNIGNACGFELKYGSDLLAAAKTSSYITGVYNLSLNLGWCSWMQITNNSFNSYTYFEDFSDWGGWHSLNYHAAVNGETFTFTQGFYSNRLLSVFKPSSPNTIAFQIAVY